MHLHQPQLKVLQVIAFNHHCQQALKRIHPRVDTDYQRTRISDYRPRQCPLQKVQVLLRSHKNCGRRHHLISIVIVLPSRRSNPETQLEVLRTGGGLVLRSEAIAWMVAGAREAHPIHDAVRMTVIGDQDVKICIAGPNVDRLLAVTMTARGTAKETLGNEIEIERRIEVAESPTVRPLAGIANESGMLEEADSLLDQLGILLEMIVCHPLGTLQVENVPVTRGMKRCVL